MLAQAVLLLVLQSVVADPLLPRIQVQTLGDVRLGVMDMGEYRDKPSPAWFNLTEDRSVNHGQLDPKIFGGSGKSAADLRDPAPASAIFGSYPINPHVSSPLKRWRGEDTDVPVLLQGPSGEQPGG
jgi:hypothetical protein